MKQEDIMWYGNKYKNKRYYAIIAFLFVCNLISGIDKIAYIMPHAEQLNSNYSIERLYIHQDRQHYAAGETIWLKVYQIIDNNLLPHSGIAYVDLINDKGTCVTSLKLPLINHAGIGQLSIPTNTIEGSYLLIAYTQWMRNFSSEGFYQRPIYISSKLKPIQKKSIPKSILRFYPEGGNMIDKLASKIAFEFISAQSATTPRQACIINHQNDTVKQFTVPPKGMGYFYFKPKMGNRYQAYVQGIEQPFELPPCEAQGFILNVKQLNNIVRVNISHNYPPDAITDSCHLLLHQYGCILGRFPIDKSQSIQLIDLPVSQLPTGVYTLSIINSEGHAYAERLLFSKYPQTDDLSIETKCITESEHKKLIITIGKENGTLENGSYSLAVTKSELENYNQRHNIKSYSNLGSELSNRVLPSVNEYWQPNNKKSLLDIDLLLLTHGWRRYSTKEFHVGHIPIKFPMEQTLTLSGQVNQVKKSKASQIEVQALFRQDTIQQWAVFPINEDGKFRIEGFDFQGKRDVLLSAFDNKNHEYYICVDTIPALSYKFFVNDHWNFKNLTVPSWNKDVETSSQTVVSDSITETYELAEINVTARKKSKTDDNLNAYSKGFVKSTYTPPHNLIAGDIRSLLRRVPGITMKPDQSKGGLHNAHINGLHSSSPAQFVVNGYRVYDAESVYSMDASQVERVDIMLPTNTTFGGFQGNGGLISIVLRKGTELYPSETKLHATYQWIGYSQVKEFYSLEPGDTHFFTPSNKRPTLYWNPNIKTDADGKATITIFLNGAEAGDYWIHCEGRDKNGAYNAKGTIQPIIN